MNCVLLFAKMDQVFSGEKHNTFKKILEKSGNFVGLENWEHAMRF